MSQTFDIDDDLRPEYDFTQMTVVARGEGRKCDRRSVHASIQEIKKGWNLL